jgi:hypothetical protein
MFPPLRRHENMDGQDRRQEEQEAGLICSSVFHLSHQSVRSRIAIRCSSSSECSIPVRAPRRAVEPASALLTRKVRRRSRRVWVCIHLTRPTSARTHRFARCESSPAGTSR